MIEEDAAFKKVFSDTAGHKYQVELQVDGWSACSSAYFKPEPAISKPQVESEKTLSTSKEKDSLTLKI